MRALQQVQHHGLSQEILPQAEQEWLMGLGEQL